MLVASSSGCGRAAFRALPERLLQSPPAERALCLMAVDGRPRRQGLRRPRLEQRLQAVARLL
eukprot:2276679-Alexandrium_andersonii.AAC.1